MKTTIYFIKYYLTVAVSKISEPDIDEIKTIVKLLQNNKAPL